MIDKNPFEKGTLASIFFKIDKFFNGSKISTPKKRTTQVNNKKSKKGAEYESLIAKLFRCRGYTVLENGKAKGKKDGGIDLVAMKPDETILIQCKNWTKGTGYTIGHVDLKKFRIEGVDFFEENIEYKASNEKMLFILSEDCLHQSAKYHLEDIKKKGKKVDIEIIPIFNAEKEIKDSANIIVEDGKICPRCNQGYLVLRTLKNKKYQGKYKQEEFLGCSRFPACKHNQEIEQSKNVSVLD